MRWVVSGKAEKVLAAVTASPDLVRMPAIMGASREEPSPYFFTEIKHYMYPGDTLLHMAAAPNHPAASSKRCVGETQG
jgi:hypothetical protein